MQNVDPVPDWYVPEEQLVHPLAPTAEYMPATHFKQLDDADDPEVARYVPAEQATQAVDVVNDWNMPAAQLKQLEDATAALIVMYLPVGQLAQLVDPVALAKVPAAQLVQADDEEAPTVLE
jgi:hypothetical protein